MVSAEPDSPSDEAATASGDALEPSHPLPRLTNKVFTDLAIWMAGFGLGIGIVFPIFVTAVGVPARYVMTERFFVATISAGLVVGATNQFLSRVVVRSRLRVMRSKMRRVEEALRNGSFGEAACTPEKCRISVDSDDELGEAAASFNHLVEALAASHQLTQVARRFATVLASHIELGPLTEAALSELEGAGTHSASALYAVSDLDLVLVASRGIVDPEHLATRELVQEVYRSLATRVVELPDDVVLDGGVVEFRPRTVVLHPLHVGRVPIGVLLVASAKRIEDTEIQLFEQLLSSFAVALTNSVAHGRLQRIAAVDELTGLYNRRLGLERLSEELDRSDRSAEPLGLILFDLDDFKSVNDTYGHQVGDHLLRAVANAVAGVLRESDTLIRYGGDEFLALLPAAGDEALLQLSERIRVAVESCAVVGDSIEAGVTASVGGVSYSGTGSMNVEQLISRADAAMYAAKAAGRNTLVLSSR